jgi:O-antigen ligase
LNVVGYATIFFACRYGLARRTYGLALIILLVVFGLAETIFGYYLSQHSDFHDPKSLWFPFGPTEQLNVHYWPRWNGSYGNPNHYASLLIMALGGGLALGGFSKFPWPLRIIFFYVSAVIMVGIIYSGSRGGWVALVASICGILFFTLRYGTVRWWVPVTAVVLLFAAFGGLLATSPLVRERMGEARDTLSMGQLDQYIRVQLAEDALRIAHDHPIFGTGPATFTFVHPQYQSSTFAYLAELTHDDYLNVLDDYGLIGFALAIFFVIVVTLTFLRPFRSDARWPDRVAIVTGFAAWCALLAHSALDFNLHIPANAMILFALTGLGLRRLPGEERPRHWSTLSLAPMGRWLGGILFVFGLAYAAEVARTEVGDFHYEAAFANAATEPTIQSIQELQKALAADPDNEPALVLLGDLYRVRAAHHQDIEGRVSEGQSALDAYLRAQKANPLDAGIEARQGLIFDVMRRYSEAFFCYQAAVKAEPYNGEFWNALGNHYWERNLLPKAEEAYLMAAHCPHGGAAAAESAREVRTVLDAEGVPPPVPGTNPLEPPPERPEPPTTP